MRHVLTTGPDRILGQVQVRPVNVERVLRKVPYRYNTVFYIFTFEIFDLEKPGQGQRVQHSQWCHSIANIEIYKFRLLQFCASIHRVQDINI